MNQLSRDHRVEIESFLSEHKAFCLSTISVENQVSSAPLYYVHDDFLKLYFCSDETAEHSVNLVLHKNVAASIYREGHTFSEINGLQMKGQCEVLTETSKVRDLYINKFNELSENETMLKRFDALKMYCFKVNWLRWIKMEAGKPTRVESFL